MRPINRPRKTATFIEGDIKEKSIVEAQKYEIDKKQIYDFYGIIPKKERIYKVIKKQIAFGKENFFSKIKIEHSKQYSNYLVFREIFQKEIDNNEIKYEMEEIKALINLSENTRDEFYRYFHLDRADALLYGDTITPISTDNKSKSIKYKKPEKITSVSDFIKKCKMLRRKRDGEDEEDKGLAFKVFSDLNIPSNKFEAMDSVIGRKNKLNIKYYQQKQKLLRCFNREERFVNYSSLVKECYIKETPDLLKKNTKDKYSSLFFDVIYDKREEAHYETIDAFFSKYNICSFKLKEEEKDFYGKIYGILCKNNYMKFLSYLYTKNPLFKFIYDEFSDRDATLNEFSLENSLASHIQYKLENKLQTLTSISAADSNKDFNRQKELGIISDKKLEKISGNTAKTNATEQTGKINLYKQIGNCYIFIKVGFFNKEIKQNKVDKFFYDDEDENFNNDDDDFDENKKKEMKYKNEQKSFTKYLRECSKIDDKSVFIINSDKNLQIIDNNGIQIISCPMSLIKIIKIPKDFLKNNLPSKVIEKIYPENKIFDYYLCQKEKDKEEKEKEKEKDKDKEDKDEKHSKTYYLFKVAIKDTKQFQKSLSDDFNLLNLNNFIKSLIKNITNKPRSKTTRVKRKKYKEEDENKPAVKFDEKVTKNPFEEKTEPAVEKENENENENENDNQLDENSVDNKNDKNEASILNSSISGVSEKSVTKMENIEKIIKDSNDKKTSNNLNNHMIHEFMIRGEKHSYDITGGELRYKSNDNKIEKLPLSTIVPQKVVQSENNTDYLLEIKKGKKVALKVISEDKEELERFYEDLVKAKKLAK